MLKSNINSKIEIDTDKISNVLVINHTDEDIIKTTILNLENIKANESLNNIIYPTIEYATSYSKNNEFIIKESSRSIGYTTKVRVVLFVESINKATLIITSNSEFMSYKESISLYRFIIGENSNYITKDIKKNICNSCMPVKWGVPNWSKERTFSQCNSISINEISSKNLSNYNSDKIVTALMATLAKYKSTGAKILVKENDYENEKLSVAIIDDNQAIKIIKESELSKDVGQSYEASIIFTNLIDSNYEYFPCLSSIYPVTICVTKVEGLIKNIKVMASEKYVHTTVLEQFVKLLKFYMDNMENNKKYSIDELLSLKLSNEVYEQYPLVGNNKIVDEYNNYNLVEIINDITTKYSDKVALSYDDKSFTYLELAQKSDIIAKKLISYGVTQGDKVVVSLPQNADLIILIVAIIKAGGVYIPVDPNYPIDRISFVVEDSSAPYIISNLEREFFEHKINSISVSNLMNNDDYEVIKNIELPKAPVSNGYVIYTSGTSGQPKGVSVPARNIVALIEATKEEFNLTENDTWTMLHSYSFDFSVWEMWGCILTGGRLVVVPREIAKSHYDLYSLLVKEQVTILNQTPASFYTLQKVDSEQRDALLASIRLVIFGGEALDTSKLSCWFQRYPSSRCRIVNMYGITETTVHVTYRSVFKRDPEFLAKSVGVPLPGWEISIRDINGEVCLIGMEGEIWVGGVGLANGYLNRDQLNKEKFIVDTENQKRWYRSGDLGRFRADGSIDYLGRIDNQVKIRGFRIELDEIKNVIRKVPYVRDAVVTVFDGDGNHTAQKQIIAFIESKEKHTSDEVRQYLQTKIPEYMIPTRILSVKEIPMTINGKVDYKALIANANNTEIEFDKQSINNENIYVDIWSKVLGYKVSEEDNFFKCGGNSLLSVELLSELKKQVDSTLTLKDLYIHSSPKNMKEFLLKKTNGGL